MIILNRLEIKARIDFSEAVQAIEAAFKAQSAGKANLPPVGHIAFPKFGGDCHIKYGHLDGDDIFVIKIATGFAGNAALGLASGNGLSLALSVTTGEVIAILHDEMMMTDIRTGIAGAIASKALARANSRNILIVGTGVQARQQIQAHAKLFTDQLQFYVWGREYDKAVNVKRDCTQFAEVNVVEDLVVACRNADIIVTTTGSTRPLIMSDWIRPGTHITAVGADAPGKQELEGSIVSKADCLVADLASQSLDHGEFQLSFASGLITAEKVSNLGDVLTKKVAGRKADRDISIADLTGLAVQDIAMVKVVLSAAPFAG